MSGPRTALVSSCVGLGRAVLGRLPLGVASYGRTAAFPQQRRSTGAFQFQISRTHQLNRVESVSSHINDEKSPERWRIKMLYDGDCPLCMREVNMLKERNKDNEAIKFVDISSQDYSSLDNQGLSYETVMGRIHAVLADGTVLRDVEAFRRLYEEVGLGWVFAITKYKPVAAIANVIYTIWAKYRLQITGRPPLEEILDLRKKKLSLDEGISTIEFSVMGQKCPQKRTDQKV